MFFWLNFKFRNSIPTYFRKRLSAYSFENKNVCKLFLKHSSNSYAAIVKNDTDQQVAAKNQLKMLNHLYVL